MAWEKKQLFETEWAILKVVWEKQPVTAPDVRESLASEKQWAYTTVKTLMDRMAKKGLLRVQRIRNLYLYSAAISKAEAVKSEIKRTLKRAFDGAFTPMVQFLVEHEQLSDEEFQYLEQLIQDRQQQGKE
ncbi:MAG: BlaI/MecI/CopY family transcriptional regulator [Planctomycetes bacterium]|nr:BlaI/MecI/CopY family transcriptional regulator [Planctomycetota bacterium]